MPRTIASDIGDRILTIDDTVDNFDTKLAVFDSAVSAVDIAALYVAMTAA